MSLNVLVAEDNLFTLQQYRHILEKNGCKVTVAHNGEECIQKFNEAFLTLNSELIEEGHLM